MFILYNVMGIYYNGERSILNLQQYIEHNKSCRCGDNLMTFVSWFITTFVTDNHCQRLYTITTRTLSRTLYSHTKKWHFSGKWTQKLGWIVDEAKPRIITEGNEIEWLLDLWADCEGWSIYDIAHLLKRVLTFIATVKTVLQIFFIW